MDKANILRSFAFFRSLIDNAQTGLGRSDRAVARLYARLVAPDGGACLLAVRSGGGPFTAWESVFTRA